MERFKHCILAIGEYLYNRSVFNTVFSEHFTVDNIALALSLTTSSDNVEHAQYLIGGDGSV